MLTFKNVDILKCEYSKMWMSLNVDILKCGYFKICNVGKVW